MKTAWIIPLVLLSSGLNAAVVPDLPTERTDLAKYESTQSPSRRYIALFGMGLADVSPSIRMRIRILVVGIVPVRIRQITPWVHDPCVVIWARNEDVLLVCGRGDDFKDPNPPFEISAHQFDARGLVRHRNPTPEERNLLVAAFEAKYGHAPSPVVDGDRPYDAFGVSPEQWP